MIEDKKNKGIIPLLFELLEKEKVPYVVLRNYENLPEKPLEGSDIDLLVDKENEEKYFTAFKNALSKASGFILLKIRQSNCLSCFIYQKEPFSLGTWVDAFLELSTKGFVFADSKYLLEKRIRHEKGFFIPPPGGEAAVLFAKEVLQKPFIKKRYCLKIPDFVRIDKENFIKTLRPYFKEKVIEEMAEICLCGKWDEVSKKRKNWRNNLILNHFLKRPFNQISQILNFIFSQIKKFFTPQKGFIIAILGPDGVGKTTACEGLRERIKNFFFRKTFQYHSHFGFFPELGKIYSSFFGKQFSKEGNAISQEKPIGLARAILHLFYYGLEYFLAWPLAFWLKIRGNLILFDRYFYDSLAANTNSQFSFWLFWQIAKIIPRPDLIFIIKARPEIIYERKKDLSLKEIKRQIEVLQSWRISRISPSVFIDGEEAPNLILNKMEEEILKIISKKYGEK